jgi:hypothetical protein
MTAVSALSRALAERIDALVAELLPGGHREGHEWRAGSVAGEAGHSLGVHLTGDKRGIWCDFATGEGGDALDLVKAVLRLSTREALSWARRWLGLDDGRAELLQRRPPAQKTTEPPTDPDRWRNPWRDATPIRGTVAERYIASRQLLTEEQLEAFDPEGDVLRFAVRRARRNQDDIIEHHPALLALLRDWRTGERCGLINVHLLGDGSDRVRDKKGKTVAGRAKGGAVMLDDFAEVTMGLTVCEGIETGIAVYQSGLRPVWALGGAFNVKNFPVLGGIEALTIAADTGKAGQEAAATLAKRWRSAGREVRIVTPSAGDWADPK